MFPSDASQLQSHIMTHNRCTQKQAQEWLDKWVPHWRWEEPRTADHESEQIGEDDNEE